MNVIQEWTESIQGMAAALWENLDKSALARVSVETPKDASHGHLATNAAMVLAKTLGFKPIDLAHKLCEALRRHEDVVDAQIAGPGFINISLRAAYWQEVLAYILKHPEAYGKSHMGQGQIANVEYVSCNPTGPMHIGHSRGAIVGDVLANLYKALGYSVVKEFYCNDAGQQVIALARSVYKRYCETQGTHYEADVEYPGDYLQPVAEQLVALHGNTWLNKPETEWLEFFRQASVDAMMQMIRTDLQKLGIQHDVFTSEKSLIDRGLVQQAIDRMNELGVLYQGVLPKPKGHDDHDWEPREQLLFRSTEFGDDTDRALLKSDGSFTYFTSDVAYHADKIARGAQILVNVWGADHAGYIKRMEAAVAAMSRQQRSLKVLVCQLIKFMKNGEAVKMSKRAGTFVTVDDVLAEVDKDVVRFVMLTRRNDAPLDFDFAKVVEQSRDNPVFYVHYAHARICSVLRHAHETFGDYTLTQDIKDLFYDDEDYALIRLLGLWPKTIELAALSCEPHRIAFYLYDLAGAFHALWTKGKDDVDLRFIHSDNWEKTQPRLMLLQGIKNVFVQGFRMIGIREVEELH